MSRTVVTILLLSTAAIAVTAEPVSATTFKVEYEASLMGLPVGKLNVSSAIGPRAYEIQASGKLAGAAGLFSDGKGGAVVIGTLRNGSGNPVISIAKSSFQASVRLGKSSKAVHIETVGGEVSSFTMEPPMDDKPGRVPLRAEHKRAVVDPLSAFIMPMHGASPKAEDCNRILPVFDGGARLNIVMSYAETRQVELGGYNGQALVCKVRYVPLAGHRPDRRIIKYMEANQDMSVWLVPVGGVSFLVPLRVSIKTVVGTAVLEARRWSVDAAAGK